jgi:acyl-CoA synthetase (AMP-forming)/AMP-acid ligase II
MTPFTSMGTRAKTVPFAAELAAHGDRVALVTADAELSYRDLAARVAKTAARLGGQRRLVLLVGGNTIDSVIVYLAALASGHPLLLAPGDQPVTIDALIAAYDPDIVVRVHGVGERPRVGIEERRAIAAHDLHPDLALLLSTSGSTGAAKLVRLSHDNLQANATSIATYLAIGGGDRAATTLRMHYCYGLSVINSHLLRGASLLLTGHSVADPGFWELFRECRGTTFAGVPYTFDLLDRVGFDQMRLPHLRYVTQAGGRLAPDRVRRYAAAGRRAGWDLVVMYGQTEATARMAYLPAELAATHPYCIGIPIPGGSFRLDPLPDWPDPDTGELVYTGPNVMLGYAHAPADLGLGRTVHELRTGDIARRTRAGLYEIVGRQARFAKLFGLRIDLQQVEAALERHGLTACCVDSDNQLVVAVAGAGGDAAGLRRLAARACGLPPHAVRVCFLAELPRLANGKPDYPAVRALTREAGQGQVQVQATPDPGAAPEASRHTTDADPAGVRALFAETLDLDPAEVTDDSTFASLGGDSLSYVELSIRLEQALGDLPAEWHQTPIRDLRPATRPPAQHGAKHGAKRGRTRALDTSVALRAISIVLIVGSHARLFDLPGGAHLLLGVAGFNFARFHLTTADRRGRARSIGKSAGRIAITSMLWIALASLLLTDTYTLTHVFLVNYLAGPPGRFNEFWFIETLVYTLVAVLVLVMVGPVDRVERRFPLALPLALMSLGLVTRYELIPGVDLPTPLVAFWLFALGWAAAKATTVAGGLWVTLAVVATIPGFHGDPQREAVMMGGLALLVWVPTVPSTHLLNRVAGVLAASSLYIYLTHWQVYPRLAGTAPLLAVLASLAAGVGYATLATRATATLSSLHRHRHRSWPWSRPWLWRGHRPPNKTGGSRERATAQA